MWLECGCMSFLGICAAYDYRTKTVPLRAAVVFGLFACVARLFEGTLFTVSTGAGALMGLLFLLAGKRSGSRIGEGDGWMLTVTGLYLGLWGNAELCLLAVLAAAAGAAWMLAVKKRSLQDQIPFGPFLLGAYCLMLILQATGS